MSRAFSRQRRRDAGFTLIELTVALVAGLAVVLGLMTLSREASRTFNEEVRSTASEASLRTANDRLRADLARAGFMSTGNIQMDPRVCLPLGATMATVLPQPPAAIGTLQSILLVNGGSVAANGIALSSSQNPAVSPDVILIAGNMTTAEQLPVLSQAPAPSGNCTRLTISPVSPALYRIAPTTMTLANQSAELANAFQPVASKSFIVRLVDETGAAQFLETCTTETTVAGFDANNMPYVDIDAATPIYTPLSTKTKCGVGNISSGHVYVNPVQVVRWEIVQASVAEATNAAQYSGALGNLSTAYGTIDPNKYDLVRSYADITSATIPAPPIYASMEVVAEYAVDLDFAFTVDSGTAIAPSPQTFAFEDDTDNNLWTGTVSTTVGTSKPQRLRETRFRIVTRTAQGDRTVNVAVSSPANYTKQEYMYRYCINPTACALATPNGTFCWARARTVTGETSFPNLETDYY
jgi:type II secretory pathway pseudopilin PulG